MTGPVVLELPFGATAPGLARQFVTEHGAGLPPTLLEDAQLLVSEVVTNAVRHGAPSVTLELRLHPPGIGVSVSDLGDALPILPDGRPDPTVPSGRGLLIVAALADTWGIAGQPDEPGKTVWFELRADQSAD